MPPADKVSHASLNGIYVKAQELDRGHNDEPAPLYLPPGATAYASDAETHASDWADAETHASDWADAEAHPSDRM